MPGDARRRIVIEVPENIDPDELVLYRIEEGFYVLVRKDKLRKILKSRIRARLSQEKTKPAEAKTQKREQKTVESYWVFTSEDEARTFCARHRASIEAGELRGVRGFDGNFYVIRTSLLARLKRKILPLLEEERTVSEISEKLGLPKDLVKCVLEIMREDGLVFEVRGGTYRRA